MQEAAGRITSLGAFVFMATIGAMFTQKNFAFARKTKLGERSQAGHGHRCHSSAEIPRKPG